MKEVGENKSIRGFSLLEVMVSMLLLAMLMTMIFSISKSSLGVSRDVKEIQNESAQQEALFHFFRDHFLGLPGNARLDLSFQDTSTHYLSHLVVEGVPTAFSFGSRPMAAEAIEFETVLRRDKFLDIVLKYYDEPLLDRTGQRKQDLKPSRELTLYQKVWVFEWEALDDRTLEWQYDWKVPSRQPFQLKLKVKFTPQDELKELIFFIPPKENPETVINRSISSGRQANNGQPNPGGPNPGGPNPGGPNPGGPNPGGPNPGGPNPSGPNPSGPNPSGPNPPTVISPGSP